MRSRPTYLLIPIYDYLMIKALVDEISGIEYGKSITAKDNETQCLIK